MIIKKGVVYKGSLYIRIPYDRSKGDITICEKVKCRYATKDEFGTLVYDENHNVCLNCSYLVSHFMHNYKRISKRHYYNVPYDN